MNQFLFNDMNSYDDCGLYIEKRPAPMTPQRDITKTHIPGRSGDVIQDNGCYLNTTLTYKVSCSDIDSNLDAIKKMFDVVGYAKLFDTYDPDFYRYASVSNLISFEEELLNVGRANIEFDCEPYRYLTMGMYSRKLSVDQSNMTSLTNEYDHNALPKIYFQAAAGTTCTIMVNSESFSYTMPPDQTKVYIDSASESCYFGGKNLVAGYNSDSWPCLLPGANTLCVIGAINALIYPRWRTI